MIQSAMMFALGAFVSGLLWLALSVALVRRARGLTERRLLAGIATRRAEFDTERDELRARHAVQMHRLEREVSRVLDMATAHRLEADLKERDLNSVRAELLAREEDVQELDERLTQERDLVQDLERRNAEMGAGLRAAQHTLKLEAKRRTVAEEALDEIGAIADQRRHALIALRAENDELRNRLGEPPAPPLSYELEHAKAPRIAPAPEPVIEVQELPAGVVALPTRPRPAQLEVSEQPLRITGQQPAEAERAEFDGAELSLVNGEDSKVTAYAPPLDVRMPVATMPGEGNIGELVALRMVRPDAEKRTPSSVEENAEKRFFEALREIRALKRAANQAGE
jgi:hypothetical protein